MDREHVSKFFHSPEQNGSSSEDNHYEGPEIELEEEAEYDEDDLLNDFNDHPHLSNYYMKTLIQSVNEKWNNEPEPAEERVAKVQFRPDESLCEYTIISDGEEESITKDIDKPPSSDISSPEIVSDHSEADITEYEEDFIPEEEPEDNVHDCQTCNQSLDVNRASEVIPYYGIQPCPDPEPEGTFLKPGCSEFSMTFSKSLEPPSSVFESLPPPADGAVTDTASTSQLSVSVNLIQFGDSEPDHDLESKEVAQVDEDNNNTMKTECLQANPVRRLSKEGLKVEPSNPEQIMFKAMLKKEPNESEMKKTKEALNSSEVRKPRQSFGELVPKQSYQDGSRVTEEAHHLQAIIQAVFNKKSLRALNSLLDPQRVPQVRAQVQKGKVTQSMLVHLFRPEFVNMIFGLESGESKWASKPKHNKTLGQEDPKKGKIKQALEDPGVKALQSQKTEPEVKTTQSQETEPEVTTTPSREKIFTAPTPSAAASPTSVPAVVVGKKMTEEGQQAKTPRRSVSDKERIQEVELAKSPKRSVSAKEKVVEMPQVNTPRRSVSAKEKVAEVPLAKSPKRSVKVLEVQQAKSPRRSVSAKEKVTKGQATMSPRPATTGSKHLKISTKVSSAGIWKDEPVSATNYVRVGPQTSRVTSVRLSSTSRLDNNVSAIQLNLSSNPSLEDKKKRIAAEQDFNAWLDENNRKLLQRGSEADRWTARVSLQSKKMDDEIKARLKTDTVNASLMDAYRVYRFGGPIQTAASTKKTATKKPSFK